MIDRTRFRDLPALELSDDAVRLTVIPGWGGKVAEIVDRRRGRSWLSENAALPYRLPEYGADYVGRFDVGGFDECFPTVGACVYPTEPWSGTPLPDHGEVWALSWEAEVDGDVLRLSTQGVRLPYRLEKSIRLIGDGTIRFDYRASNPTPHAMEFLWSSHPLLAVRPSMRIGLPVAEMRVYSALGSSVQPGDVLSWPHWEELDLSRVPPPDAGLAVKLFSQPLEESEGWAEVSEPADGAKFRFTFDPTLVTHLGLWLNYGGWAGVPGAEPYFNVGLEPCIGAPDTLEEAVQDWGEFGQLAPNGSRTWWLQITVS